MKFEHFGINVPDARAMAKWYVDNCSMKIVRAKETEPLTYFLADSTDRVVMEIYTNPADPIPDYSQQHHLRYHFALAVDDPGAVGNRLIDAGATFAMEETLADGSFLILLRDPWDIPLQLVKRAEPMV